MTGVEASQATFFLTFHGIGEPGPHVGEAERRYWVSKETFTRIIQYVAHAGEGAYPPMAVTFDDGNVSDAEIALPILAEAGLKARFFVLAGRFGMRDYLSEGDVRRLAEAGMRVGSHGWNHVDWRKADDRELARELRDSKLAIADATGMAVEEAAIPFGAYDGRVLKALRAHGYTAIFSSDGGLARTGPLLTRNTVVAGEQPEDIARRRFKACRPTMRLKGQLKTFVKAVLV